MKKIIGLLLTLTVVVQFLVIPVKAEEVQPIYLLEPEDISSSRFPVSKYNGDGMKVVGADESEDGEAYIEVHDTDTSVGTGFQISADPMSGSATIEFDYYLDSDSASGGTLYAGSSKGSCICVQLQKKITAVGGAYYFVADTEVKTDAWEKITIVVDVPGKKYSIYLNGLELLKDYGFRDKNPLDGAVYMLFFGDAAKETKFRIKNFKIYDKAIIPELSEDMMLRLSNPERNLVDYTDAKARLDGALKDAIAMTIGNSVARVDNKYVSIYEGEPYVAPYISPDGSTLVPVRFVTESIGCEVEVLSLTQFKIHKGGTTIELNTGDKNAIINGVPVEMPTAPVITKDRLFIPLRFAAETFGKKVFWDDRGLIIISDNNPVKAGDEDIIKPLIFDIRYRSDAFGNPKYSDVSLSSRSYYSKTSHCGSTFAATKRFMATSDRWTYAIAGEDNKKLRDQGVFIAGTLNANVRDGDEAPGVGTIKQFDGSEWKRADGANGTTWGCVNNPAYENNVKMRMKRGIESGLFSWQFDDWVISGSECYCEYCVESFRKYLEENVSPEKLAEIGVADIKTFNYKQYLLDDGVKTIAEAAAHHNKELKALREEHREARLKEFHNEIIADIKAETGNDVFYSLNAYYYATHYFTSKNEVEKRYIFFDNVKQGIMAETPNSSTTADGLYSMMLFTEALGARNIVSPIPSEQTKEFTNASIAMAYATGQSILVPWDTWLYGSTRYYASAEDLKGVYELVREYPYLFDNYENPASIGYVFDTLKLDNEQLVAYCKDLLEKGVPAKALVHRLGPGTKGEVTFDLNDLKGIHTVIAATDISDLTEPEKQAIAGAGLTIIPASDKAAKEAAENADWMVRNNTADVYTTLRVNNLYDNAPVVVHAVNYDTVKSKQNVAIEINNSYLPAGDTLKINVYSPWENVTTKTIVKGNGVTKVTLDNLDRWTVLEICGEGTIRRGVNFNINGYSGIGLGTRISNDSAVGTPQNFNIVTYSEGINSTTYGDDGCQDEAAFVYSRLGESGIKTNIVSAGFGEHDGTHGLMYRESLQSNSPMVAFMYDNENGLRLGCRKYIDKGVVYKKLEGSAPAFMKLERLGDKYTAYVSADGVNYTEVGSCEIPLAQNIGGVFASSPNGAKSVCPVSDFLVADGKFPSEEFEVFRMSYKNGKIADTEEGAKIKLDLSTKSIKNIDSKDVQMTFTSSNESVIKVDNYGVLSPKKEGKATISAIARMGLKSISASMNIEVYAAPKGMYAQEFKGKELPAEVKVPGAGETVDAKIVNGALRISTKNDNGSFQSSPIIFSQITSKNACFEFDFRAHFGKTQPTTGAGVIYGNNGGWAMTCDVGRFNWFFKDDQRYVMDMEGDKWYHIKIYIDYVNQLADVYVDGEKIVDKGELKAPCGQDGIFWIRAWRCGVDTYYEWDNFNVYFAE